MRKAIVASAAITLGVAALAGCGSSAKPAAGTSTTTTSGATTTSRKAPAAPTTRGTTATTGTSGTGTVPPVNSPAALSSTWVSPQQGWVLEKSGTIDETTNSGATWHTAGTLALGTDAREKLRFIGPSDGFAFDPGRGALQITHDAGATWINLDTPFTSVYDLAISRGMVYVVGLPTKNTGNFGIWSTPVEHLVWKQSPLALQIGAGPVPSPQIVLQGSAGWIIEVDRTVIAGARLATNGQWVSWIPPCRTVNGPAYLSASTTTDLVASCDEGVWGPPKEATTAYFSHDAGSSFGRQTAPGFGPVMSPTSNTAVVATNSGLQRTINGGTTWASVYPETNANAANDLGFTTTTQGFVITGDGRMLMTFDAGATWKQMTLP